MKKRLLSFVLIFALVLSSFVIVPTKDTQAKKHSPKYYQNKLKKFVKKHGKKDGSEYTYKYEYDELTSKVTYDTMLNEIDFCCSMYRPEEDNEDDDTFIYVSMYFDRGNNTKARIYASYDMTVDGKDYEIEGWSKYQRIKKFSFKKLKFPKIKSYIGQKKGKKLLKKLIKPCFPVWKEMLKIMGLSFKKIGLKKLK